jgi:F-type H+-transporting ATPase subunit delta
VQAVINNPKVSRAQLFGLMEALIGKTASVQQLNFVHVLAENQRLSVLPEIAATFEALKAEAEKTVNVVVDSAFELSATQQEKIIASMKKRMGREVKLTCNIKKELLGGVVIRAGDKVIDGSARTRLGEMAVALA